MGLRQTLGGIPLARSAWHLARELRSVVCYGAAQARAEYEREFARARDPWAFETDPVAGRDRFNRELAMLDAIRHQHRFPRALEIGCAEGMFTELLAPRCEHLLAVDNSAIALARARERCAWGSHVRFAKWELGVDPMPGVFDLVIVEGVLDSFCRPWTFRAVRDTLVAALPAGGYLLAGNPRHVDVVEGAWWGRHLIRGGTWIDTSLADHPQLSIVATARQPSYVDTLFRKVG